MRVVHKHGSHIVSFFNEIVYGRNKLVKFHKNAKNNRSVMYFDDNEPDAWELLPDGDAKPVRIIMLPEPHYL
jgi:hypothetical protein